MEFKEYTLKKILAEKGYIRGPFGSALKRGEMIDKGIPVYEQKNAINDSRTFRYFIDRKKFQELKRFQVKENDLIISCSGTVGRVSIIKENDPEGIISQALLILRPNQEKVIPKYLYYYFQSEKGKKELLSRSSGSVQVNIAKRAIIENIQINLPPTYKQITIVDVLSNIDKKINENKKIIANLEELSQNLFKHWFVDFEFPDENGNPYKSSGGEMKESELGEIPNVMSSGKLSDVAEIIMGQSPKSDTYNSEKIGMPLLNGASDFKHRNLNPNKYTSDPKKVGKTGDFVFGVRATVGLVTELDKEYAIGRGSAIARVKQEYKEWIFEILNEAFSYFERSIVGSVYINISSKDLKNYKIIKPPKDLVEVYHQKMMSIFTLKTELKNQIISLTNLRDTLLPKLMSGEIEIPDEVGVDVDEL